MSTTYRDAGVDIEAGEAFVKDISELVRSTERPEVVGGLGGFSGLFRFDAQRYQDPLLVASTDGVGTKLKVAFALGKHDTIGQDLVAMCVNDLIVCGAEPLFFLDYYATGRLEADQGRAVLKGIADGCKLAGCALLGGETAEMPGIYHQGEYDLAGFSVGVVDRPRLLGSQRVVAGDRLLGLASDGLHSNGYSLVRRLLMPDDRLPEAALADELIRPTRIYVKPVLALMAEVQLHALAHITGGGLPGNLPRVLPDDLAAEVQRDSWPVPDVFVRVQQSGDVATEEMLRTFNMGVGMVAVLPADQVDSAVQILDGHGIRAWDIGWVRASAGGDRFQIVN